MNRNKKLKNNLSSTMNCQHCDHCTYIGEGDYICDMTNEGVIVDFNTPTENYYSCEGKDFVKG